MTFRHDGHARIGIETKTGIVPLDELVPGAPDTMLGVIDAGEALLSKARQALSEGKARPVAGEVRLMAPVPVPRANVMCVGKNYYEHAAEFEGSGFDSSSGGQNIPEVPIFFTKVPGSVIGPDDEIDGSLDTDGTLDYEGELTLVIGKEGRRIPPEKAYEHIFGYTIINDVTARATQQRHKQWFLGKSFDTFCPMGPAIVTADEIPDPTVMQLQTRVNGELRQNVSVKDLIFDIPTMIAAASHGMTLRPGDLIATGTPAGVGIGFKPPKYLKAGDVVDVTIEPIGTLTNRVA
ncbi:Fumarylacetoacetate hydrolase family protein [Lutibaculum baratangense AMV1]|uniref:Fumarylacetoacetate hydrolase family protein n=1 Tax=Lutibaculum baratangense AMV1 TaxID=631454 RepID=V4RAW2_9HYPH|nr:Fumarylacetoacetate hydrolase family protein [Lutibaculum baratangense AMV1]